MNEIISEYGPTMITIMIICSLIGYVTFTAPVNIQFAGDSIEFDSSKNAINVAQKVSESTKSGTSDDAIIRVDPETGKEITYVGLSTGGETILTDNEIQHRNLPKFKNVYLNTHNTYSFSEMVVALETDKNGDESVIKNQVDKNGVSVNGTNSCAYVRIMSINDQYDNVILSGKQITNANAEKSNIPGKTPYELSYNGATQQFTFEKAGGNILWVKVVDSEGKEMRAKIMLGVLPDVSVSMTAPTPVENLVYTGQMQTLINPGTAVGGIFYYSLDGKNWSTELPKGKDIKTYKVYYKVIATNEHYVNSNVRYIWVTMGHTHSWTAATCIKLSTCKLCGKTRGTYSTIHQYSSPTCVKLATCKLCGKTTGNYLPHVYTKQIVNNNYLYSAATCTAPARYVYACQTCNAKAPVTLVTTTGPSICGGPPITITTPTNTYTYGSALGHALTAKHYIAWCTYNNGTHAHWNTAGSYYGYSPKVKFDGLVSNKSFCDGSGGINCAFSQLPGYVIHFSDWLWSSYSLYYSSNKTAVDPIPSWFSGGSSCSITVGAGSSWDLYISGKIVHGIVHHNHWEQGCTRCNLHTEGFD